MADSIKILLCDDDPHVHEALSLYLDNEGFSHVSARNGREALELFEREQPDLIVLDMMMPELNGDEVCREIRRISRVPIIMLTAKSEEIDKVVGLELGADDYITKPFSNREVVARIKAVLRRMVVDHTGSNSSANSLLRFRGLELNADTYQVKIFGEAIPFTPKEFEVLYLLASQPGSVIERETIMDKVWGSDYAGDIRTIDTHVKRIRQKISHPDANWALLTVYGVGYKFEVANA